MVNCYTLIEWIFAQCGIFLPRSLIGQLYYGDPVAPDLWRPGDLLFIGDCRWGAYRDEQRAKNGVGHNGIFAGGGMVIHASSRKGTVVREGYQEFLGYDKARFRGIYRVIEG